MKQLGSFRLLGQVDGRVMCEYVAGLCFFCMSI